MLQILRKTGNAGYWIAYFVGNASRETTDRCQSFIVDRVLRQSH